MFLLTFFIVLIHEQHHEAVQLGAVNSLAFIQQQLNSVLIQSIKLVSTLCPLQVPRGARHTWKPERRESLTRSHSWLNLRMSSWWMNSSTDRNGRSCPTGWTWATNKWKYGFRIAGWKRNDWWCASKLSPRTDDLWTWSWPAARREYAALCYECCSTSRALGLWRRLVFMNVYKMFIFLSHNGIHFISSPSNFTDIIGDKEMLCMLRYNWFYPAGLQMRSRPGLLVGL